MSLNESWVNQGRQQHGWFGNGTSPKEAKVTAARASGSLLDPSNIGQRIDFSAFSLVGRVPRHEREQSAAAFDTAARDRLKTAVAAWHGASGLSRDAFRARLLDPYTSDATVDRLRSAARGMVEAQTHEALEAAGANLAAAVQQIGLARWPRYLADAERRAVAAVSGGSVPGVVKVGATDTAVGIGGLVILGALGLAYHASRSSRPTRTTVAPAAPTIVQQSASDDGKPANTPSTPGTDAGEALSAQPGGVVIPDDRRRHILDGDGKNNGGHGPGRGTPGKSEFPPDWSDDRSIDAIRDVASDPSSTRTPGFRGRIIVNGTRDGVDIRVIVTAQVGPIGQRLDTGLAA